MELKTEKKEQNFLDLLQAQEREQEVPILNAEPELTIGLNFSFLLRTKGGSYECRRIKLDVFKSWFDKNLTGKEIDFLLVLSFYQDKRGITRGVYYKDMMREGKMSAQTFYDCKDLLQKRE